MKINTLKDSNYFAQNSYKKQFVDLLTTQGITMVTVKTLLAPLQRYKIIKQTQAAYPLRPIKFNGFINYLQRIPKQQGYLAFWRSNGVNCWIYFTQLMVQIGMYDNLKSYCKLLEEQLEIQSDWGKTMMQRVALPFLASFCSHVFTYPLDTARVRLAMSHHSKNSEAYFTSARTCIADMRVNQKFRKVYRGFWLSNLIAFSYFNLFLETSKLFNSFELKNDGLGALSSLNVSGWLSAVLLTIVLHPLDTLRRMVQLNNLSRPVLFSNVRGVISYLRQNQSIMCTYNGLTIAIIKTMMMAPLFAIVSSKRQEVDFSSFKNEFIDKAKSKFKKQQQVKLQATSKA